MNAWTMPAPRTPGHDALMATLLRAQPVQTGTPGTGHSGDLVPFDADVRAAIARQNNTERTTADWSAR